MARNQNNDRQNDVDDDQVTSNGGNRNNQRDEDGRFASSGTRQSSARSDEDYGGSGRGRGWFGDSQGHAQAGSHSHDYTRGSVRGRDNDDDRYNRDRNAQGQFAGGNRSQDDDRLSEEADYGAWHAYGHNRGWHGYQRNAGSTHRNRDDEGRFTSSGRGSDQDDDYRSTGSRGGNRQRDDDGRFTNNNRH